MVMIRLDNAQLAYGDHPLLSDVSVAVEENDRIALIGRNGAGKSSFLRILAGTEKLDGGQMAKDKDIRVSYLPQDLPPADDTQVFDYVAGGLKDLGKLLTDYEHLVQDATTEAALNQLQVLQDAIDAQQGWDYQQRIHTRLNALNLEPTTLLSSLSGGWRKRLSIIRSMVSEPDVLLLDEPTNHLDIPAIEWLQGELSRFTGGIVLISHDRQFLDDVANKIFWLDRGQLRSFKGGYSHYLKEKDHILQVEEAQNALFDKRLAEEEKWIRQGIKARRTRNEGRVRALKAMREERKARVDQKGLVQMQIEASDKSGKRVAECKGISFEYDGKCIIDSATFNVLRGDKIGIVGRNGAGKTTLVKLILGQLTPSAGSVKLGTNLEVAYFDQNREQLNLDVSVADNLAEGREFIDINGKQKHVLSYLSDFLFTPERARSPVSTLSGGEKNRLLLAKLFSKPANLLVLDEPTNDLDIETLELLEELISDYQGTVLLISHDRAFIDQVVTSTLMITHQGRVYSYVGGFDDLKRQHGELWVEPLTSDSTKHQSSDSNNAVNDASKAAPASKPKAKKKLSYKLQRELDALPGEIDEAEKAIAELEALVSDAEFFKRDADEVKQKMQVLSDLQSKLEAYYDRWSELDDQT
ncbi:MAG: ATP-binding cassette domain-containing protein [Cellvibrionales bacterium]|nr:ATP-binding cassette domain-containing protein [Cellvibrionales bacterium]